MKSWAEAAEDCEELGHEYESGIDVLGTGEMRHAQFCVWCGEDNSDPLEEC